MTKGVFVPLHVHTEYSLLDGALRICDLVEFAKEQGWPAVSITDHGNVFGAVKLFQTAQKAGIKPIIGCEMYMVPDIKVISSPEEKYFHLTVLVKDKNGYSNLCKLIEFSYSKGFYFKPRIDYKVLQQYSKGLIIGSGCLGSHISKRLRHGPEQEADEQIKWYLKHFGEDHFFLEVMPPDTPEQKLHNDLMLERGKRFGVKVVATPDAHYFKSEHRKAHEVMLSVGTKDLLSNPDRFSFGDFRGHLKSTQEMLDAFPEHPEVVHNSVDVANLCDFEFEFGKLHFPKFEVPEGYTEESFFENESKKGLEELFAKGLIPAGRRQIYFNRLQTEIDLIVKMGYVGYFLIVSDFISWAKKKGIPVGPGRGSAAGSLVAWALKITNIDPIEYNLLFERFLNPERVSMPDIDIDFCVEGREKVIDYVREKYGHDCVCQIITFGTMMAKGVIKDVARVLGFSFKDSNSITELIPDQLKISLKEALDQEPRLKKIVDENPKVQEMMDICMILEGLTRHASKHAAGIVISPKPLREVLPLYVPQKSTDLVTQYSMVELEALGFLKMDFLGLKNLSVIDRTVKAVKERLGIDLDLDKVPKNDMKTFQLLGEGKTCGIFQFEGDGVTEVIKRLKPEKFEDLIAVNALYRPGPLGSGMVEDFIEARHGRKKPTYIFPELEPILSETYGVIVYQEQVMKIASVIAGYSLGAADILRRAMGKKKKEVMDEQRRVFISGATKRGFDAKKAEKLFELMAHFAGYGFNKSHSAAYALIAYQTAYLKAHYPAEFEAAILSFETNDPDKLREYLNKSRQAGVVILPPDINKSGMDFRAVDSNRVMFGIRGVKNIGEAALKNIFKARKDGSFFDIMDFCKRVNLRIVNKRVIESLICSGAMDCLPGTRAQKIAELEDVINLAQQEKDREKRGQIDLFLHKSFKENDNKKARYEFRTTESWTTKEALDREKEVIGFYLSSHPLDSYRYLNNWLGSVSLDCKIQEQVGKEVVVLGVASSCKVIVTKKGQRMAFLELQDQTGECEVVIFPSVFSKVEELLSNGDVFVVVGKVDENSTDRLKIKAVIIIPADNFFDLSTFVPDRRVLTLSLPESFKSDDFEKISKYSSSSGMELILMYGENGRKLRIHSSKKFAFTADALKTLENMGCEIKITFKPDLQQKWKSRNLM